MKEKERSCNFKWNPFLLRGEAPASLRFFPDGEDGEEEFASKEDLEAIKADPRLAKIYKAMQAGVTKKFQERAAESQELKKMVNELKRQNSEWNTSLSEWENFYLQHQEAIDAIAKGGGGGGERSSDGKGKGKGKQEEGGDERYDKLIEAFNRAGEAFEKRLTHMGKMLGLSMQLNELQRKNPTMDANKVLDIALKKGYDNLTDAYKDDDAYGKDILNARVEEQLKPRLEEELAKRTTNVETGSGAQLTKFELPKELPKSFADAGQQALADINAERAKGTGKP